MFNFKKLQLLYSILVLLHLKYLYVCLHTYKIHVHFLLLYETEMKILILLCKQTNKHIENTNIYNSIHILQLIERKCDIESNRTQLSNIYREMRNNDPKQTEKTFYKCFSFFYVLLFNFPQPKNNENEKIRHAIILILLV